jgi:uncharacterized protein YggU (UPF0235/DUF167 family)
MYIHVKVRANSKKEEFKKKSEDSFEVSVREKAEQNLANTRVLELIAIHFNIPQSHIRIVNGHHSPTKLLSIRDEE